MITSHALYRLSYGGIYSVGNYLSSQAVASQVFSALMSLTTVFGMGTGGPSSLSIPTVVCSAVVWAHLNGAPTGIRTRDTLIKSQVLYQLSYWCILHFVEIPTKLNKVSFNSTYKEQTKNIVGQALDLLVPPSSIHHCTYTWGLSTK